MPEAVNTRAYRGPERRRNRVFVTVNTEYHCRDRICVLVVDRHTGAAEWDHPAIGRHLSGSLRFDLDRICATVPPEIPHEGEQLCFASRRPGDEEEIVTSAVECVERPPREVVARYPPDSA
jgi:hypothetical protein